MRHKLSVFFGFFAYVVRRFMEERCTLWAGMLTYASLLALVPLLVVVLAIVAAFPVFQQWAVRVEDFILQNFIPSAGIVARGYLMEFVGRARELSLIGVAFLVLTSLLLMFSIDTVINHIWRVHRRRTLAGKFLVYWAVLTVGPILIGASIVVSTDFIPALQRAVADPGLRLLALRAVPVAISVLTFTLIYYFVPNVRVQVLHAAIGGMVSALLFELSKAAFAEYLRSFPAYEVIYGAFAVVPIFLAWSYLGWTVLLFGACFAAAFASYGRDRATGAWPEDQELLLVYRVLQHLWEAQQRGGALSPDELLEIEVELDDDQLKRVLHKLDKVGIVEHEETGAFRLIRDLRELTLIDLCREVPIGLPVLDSTDVSGRPWLAPVYRAFSELDEPLRKTLARPLSGFFEASRSEEHREPEAPLLSAVDGG